MTGTLLTTYLGLVIVPFFIYAAVMIVIEEVSIRVKERRNHRDHR